MAAAFIRDCHSDCEESMRKRVGGNIRSHSLGPASSTVRQPTRMQLRRAYSHLTIDTDTNPREDVLPKPARVLPGQLLDDEDDFDVCVESFVGKVLGDSLADATNHDCDYMDEGDLMAQGTMMKRHLVELVQLRCEPAFFEFDFENDAKSDTAETPSEPVAMGSDMDSMDTSLDVFLQDDDVYEEVRSIAASEDWDEWDMALEAQHYVKIAMDYAKRQADKALDAGVAPTINASSEESGEVATVEQPPVRCEAHLPQKKERSLEVAPVSSFEKQTDEQQFPDLEDQLFRVRVRDALLEGARDGRLFQFLQELAHSSHISNQDTEVVHDEKFEVLHGIQDDIEQGPEVVESFDDERADKICDQLLCSEDLLVQLLNVSSDDSASEPADDLQEEVFDNNPVVNDFAIDYVSDAIDCAFELHQYQVGEDTEEEEEKLEDVDSAQVEEEPELELFASVGVSFDVFPSLDRQPCSESVDSDALQPSTTEPAQSTPLEVPAPQPEDMAAPHPEDVAAPQPEDMAAPQLEDVAPPQQEDMAEPQQENVAAPQQEDMVVAQSEDMVDGSLLGAAISPDAEQLKKVETDELSAAAGGLVDEHKQTSSETSWLSPAGAGLPISTAAAPAPELQTYRPPATPAKTRRRIIGRIVRAPSSSSLGDAPAPPSPPGERRSKRHGRQIQAPAFFSMDCETPPSPKSQRPPELSARESSLTRGYDALGAQFFSIHDSEDTYTAPHLLAPLTPSGRYRRPAGNIALGLKSDMHKSSSASALMMDLGSESASRGSVWAPGTPSRSTSSSDARSTSLGAIKFAKGSSSFLPAISGGKAGAMPSSTTKPNRLAGMASAWSLPKERFTAVSMF